MAVTEGRRPPGATDLREGRPTELIYEQEPRRRKKPLTRVTFRRPGVIADYVPGVRAEDAGYGQARPFSRRSYTLAWKVPAASGGNLVNQMST